MSYTYTEFSVDLKYYAAENRPETYLFWRL